MEKSKPSLVLKVHQRENANWAQTTRVRNGTFFLAKSPEAPRTVRVSNFVEQRLNIPTRVVFLVRGTLLFDMIWDGRVAGSCDERANCATIFFPICSAQTRSAKNSLDASRVALWRVCGRIGVCGPCVTVRSETCGRCGARCA